MFINNSLQMKAESGTCNVCSAPCTSCVHRNMSASLSKVECGCERKETDRWSFIGADVLPPPRSRACNDQQHAASEISNLLSTSSSHDSYSENVESKAIMRASATCACEDVDMPPKVSSGDAAVEDQPLPRMATSNHHGLNPSCCHSAPNLHHGQLLHEYEEQHGVECHGDNMSCVTGVKDANVPACDHNADMDKKDTSCSSASTCDMLAKKNELEVLVGAHHVSHHHEIEASESKSAELYACPRESLRKKNSGSSSVNAGFSHKSDLAEFPTTKKESSPKVPSSHSPCQNAYVELSPDSKDLEGYLTFQHQGEPTECSMNDVKSSSVRPLVSMSIDRQKSAALPNDEDCKLSQIRVDSSSRTLKDHDSCSEAEIAMDGEKPAVESTKCSNNGEQFGKNTSLLEASNVQEPDIQHQLIKEGENSESDSGLYDVKVCDICGDAGVEELLAICSRCSDGAEHTYCMHIKLDKIPEGEWLCEECHLKEDAENKKVDKSDSISGTSKADNLKEKSQDFGSNYNPTNIAKLDIGATGTEVRGPTKGIRSPQKSGNMHADSQEVNSMNSKKISEMDGGSIGTTSPRKNAVLSRESSFKGLDMGKVKPTNLASSPRCPLANTFPAISRSHMSSSNPSRVEAQLHSPRGPLSKQLSFNNSNMKPKVRQLIDNLPQKQKMTREYVSSNSRKDGVVKTMMKSASFKSVSSGRSNVESVNKMQSLNSPRAAEPKGWKPVKERNMMERKNSFVLDRPVVSPSPSAGTSVPKMDLKSSQHNGNLSNKSEKGSENVKDSVGHNEVKKQTSNTFKRYELCNAEEDSHANPSAIDRSCCDADSVLQRSVTQVPESSPREHKIKDSSHSSTSRQVSSSGSRVLRCHKCNETGHTTQFCPIDKLSISALKPSTDRNLREGSNNSNKCRDAMEAAKMRTKKSNKLPDQSACSMPSTEVSYEVASKDFQSSSSGLKSLPQEGTSDGQVILRCSDADLGRREPAIDAQQAKHAVEASFLPKECDSNAIPTNSDSLNANSSTQILPDQSSLLANPFRPSIIPEIEYIWQGGFEVLRTGKLPEFFDGIQAHLSTCASPKVLEVVSHFPGKLQLDEVPCLRLWPVQFQGMSPKEDNIALLFFAKDIESYESAYGKLLENMLKNDLALRGNINELELLIFPSNKLPENCQRWNMLFFLWGVFRGRTECSKVLPDLQKQPCRPKLSTDPLAQEISFPFFEASTSQKINSHESSDKEFSRSDRLLKVKAIKSSIQVDCLPISSSGIQDRICNTHESSFVQNTSCQLAAESQQPSQLASSFPVSCLSDRLCQPRSSLGACHVPDLQMSATELCPALEREATFLWNSGSDIDGKTPVHIHATTIENLNRALPARSTHSISSYFGQGGEGSRNCDTMREKERLMKDEAGSDNEQQEHHMEIDKLSWESRPRKKRAYSPSIETVTHTFCESSKSTDEMMLWSERANFSSLKNEKEYKKIRSCSERHASRDANGSSSLLLCPLLPSYINEKQHMDGFCNGTEMAENTRSAERYFFPVDPGSVRNVVSENMHVLSLDNEAFPESSAPDLELALGGKKKSSENGVLSLLFPLVDRKGSLGSRDKLLGPAMDDEDDMSASLSLSLAFPGTERKQTDKSINKNRATFAGEALR
ncbi:protein PARALOG OF AIPP2 isoform X1 [Elaeis guineensis]|uniref:protein PARALOG OF AIPP2 isoform X1 n=1 Tax=Elaeis guineensis var. tenera TaxID=51953 RepID=UPI00057A9DA0